jgi:5-(carboxyamino)imidazole ribonucleotide synthase
MSTPIRPRIGILGAGQLAQMLAQAGDAIGVEVICAGQPGDCAGLVASIVTVDLADAEQVAKFAQPLS